MKRALAAILTLALMAALLWVGSLTPPRITPVTLTPSDGPAETASPATHPAEACVRLLLETSARGDVDGYLGGYAGPLRSRLDREVNERGRDGFSADLERAARARKSHAMFAAEPEGDSTARVVVESVYFDRNERQTYRVQKQESGDWLVVEVETARSAIPKAKYGAPAAFLAPEGVPVQGAAPGVNVETGDDEPPNRDDRDRPRPEPRIPSRSRP